MPPVEEVYRHPEDYDLEVSSRQLDDLEFWRCVITRLKPRSVLEIGCGTGRLTLPLAEDGVLRGYSVTGLDAEAAMLEKAAARARSQPRHVRGNLTLTLGDIRTADMGQEFDFALMSYGTAHHLTDEDDRVAAWQTVRRHVRPGGYFALDLTVPDRELLTRPTTAGRPASEDLQVRGRDRELRRTVRAAYDAASQNARMDYLYHSSATKERREDVYLSTFATHVYFPSELSLLFRFTGFRMESLYGSYRQEPFDDSSKLLIAVARAC